MWIFLVRGIDEPEDREGCWQSPPVRIWHHDWESRTRHLLHSRLQRLSLDFCAGDRDCPDQPTQPVWVGYDSMAHSLPLLVQVRNRTAVGTIPDPPVKNTIDDMIACQCD